METNKSPVVTSVQFPMLDRWERTPVVSSSENWLTVCCSEAPRRSHHCLTDWVWSQSPPVNTNTPLRLQSWPGIQWTFLHTLIENISNISWLKIFRVCSVRAFYEFFCLLSSTFLFMIGLSRFIIPWTQLYQWVTMEWGQIYERFFML